MLSLFDEVVKALENPDRITLMQADAQDVEAERLRLQAAIIEKDITHASHIEVFNTSIVPMIKEIMLAISTSRRATDISYVVNYPLHSYDDDCIQATIKWIECEAEKEVRHSLNIQLLDGVTLSVYGGNWKWEAVLMAPSDEVRTLTNGQVWEMLFRRRASYRHPELLTESNVWAEELQKMVVAILNSGKTCQ